MWDPSTVIDRALREADAALDWLRFQLRSRRERGRYHIQPYRGYGTAQELYISGRVLEGPPVPPAAAEDALMRNLWHSVRRLGSDEVPVAKLRASTEHRSAEMVADHEGLFHATLPHLQSSAPTLWQEIDLELIDPVAVSGRVHARGYVMVPSDEAQFGVISDIDDTVVRTEVANLVRMMRLVLLTNAHTRLPFAGVGAFYRALHCGPDERPNNPFFYVSSSPWNFYDLLTEVLEIHGIPAGPLFLKDFGLARDLLLSRGHQEHKLGAIERVFDTYPNLVFLLVGDSGQKDPEIYLEIARRYPARVGAIYIRDVSDVGRDREVHRLARASAELGVEMVLVPDTIKAAEHAAAEGFIHPDSLSRIRGEHSSERRAPGPFESVVRKE